MSGRAFAALLCVVASSSLMACQDRGDLGNPCVLVKRNDAGQPVPILEGELNTVAGDGKEFVSFGNTGCEDLVCVRDSAFVGNPDPTQPAAGYCSTQICVPDSPTACPGATEAIDKDPATKLNCREMLLDADAIAALCGTEDKTKCKQFFAGTGSPTFCARGQKPAVDAGTPQ